MYFVQIFLTPVSAVFLPSGGPMEALQADCRPEQGYHAEVEKTRPLFANINNITAEVINNLQLPVCQTPVVCSYQQTNHKYIKYCSRTLVKMAQL